MGVSKGGEGFVEEVTEVSPGPGPSDRFFRRNVEAEGRRRLSWQGSRDSPWRRLSLGPGPSDRFLRKNLVVSGKMINFAAVISNSKKL